MNRRVVIVAGLVVAAAAAAASFSSSKNRNAAPQPTASAPALIESRGTVMPFPQARETIGFTPVVPRGDLIATAVIPPLAGEDRQTSRGIAFEYNDGGSRYLLSQWPRNGIPMRVGEIDIATRPCAPLAYMAQGLIWTTRNGLVMTLQPDAARAAGNTVLRTSLLGAQARGLLAAGRCPMTRVLRAARPR